MIDLSIIIVTYNSQDEIGRLLASLTKFKPVNSEVIVVDSASSDGTRKEVEKYTDAKLIKSEVNLGYGKASNLGASRSQGEYLLILNPDTKFIDGSIDRMFSFIKKNSDVGIVAPRLNLPDGRIQSSVSHSPSLVGAIKEYIFGQSHAFSEYVPNGTHHTEVEVVYGAAILIKKEVFFKLKGFDDRYFLYFEELDLCRKIRKEGLKIIYFPETQVVHYHGQSVNQVIASHLPFGLRTLSWFIPIKRSSNYYLVRSSYIYFGFIEGFALRIFLYIFGRLMPRLGLK